MALGEKLLPQLTSNFLWRVCWRARTVCNELSWEQIMIRSNESYQEEEHVKPSMNSISRGLMCLHGSRTTLFARSRSLRIPVCQTGDCCSASCYLSPVTDTVYSCQSPDIDPYTCRDPRYHVEAVGGFGGAYTSGVRPTSLNNPTWQAWVERGEGLRVLVTATMAAMGAVATLSEELCVVQCL